MPKTVDYGDLKEGVSKERETVRLINQLRDRAANNGALGPFTTTTNASIATAWTSEDMPEGAVWSITMHAQARGTAARAYLQATALFYRNSGGTATQEGGIASTITIRTDANLTVLYTITGNKILAQVSDATARAVSWYVWIEPRVSA
jgi:hypothetical protein